MSSELSNGREDAAVPSIVIVAEDDAELRLLVGNAVRRLGHLVLEVTDVERLQHLVDALDRDRRPELIIADVRMPRADGLRVVSRLRSHDWYTPVILMSAFVSEEVEEAARALGVAAVLSKPFSLEELSRCVAAVLPEVNARRAAPSPVGFER